MTVGRRPMPTHLKILRGNPGHRALPQNEPQPAPYEAPPEPPTFLQGYACDEWYRVAEELSRIGLLTVIDVTPLAAYCQAYARWRTAEETIAEMAKRDGVLHGLMLKTRNGTPIQNPLVITAAKAANDMIRYAVEFGLTPSARARIASAILAAAVGPGSFRDSSPVKRTAAGKRRAQNVIAFIERLTIPSGFGEGQPFKLDPWEKEFIRDIYEPHRKARRVVRRAILSVARKNGKTALIASIVLAHLVGPEAIPNGEIYSAANDRDQASIVFKFARQIVAREPELRAEIEMISSTKTMIASRTGSIYRAVSAEAGTKHGYMPSLVIYDELAQAKNRELYDVFDTSFGARSEPLFVVISTQSNDPEHVLSKLIDDGLAKLDPTIVCHLYAADEECLLDDETQWKKRTRRSANGATATILVSAIRKAMRMPAEEPKVRNLFLNQRVSPTASLISRAEWMACAGPIEIPEGEEVCLGLDLSSVIDLTALVMGTVSDPAHIRPFFWKPLEHLAEHSARDFGTGSHRYQEWVASGHLFTSPGRTIDPSVVATFIAELSQRYRIRGLAYDRWRINDLLREFDRIGLQAHQDGPTDERGLRERPGDGLRLVPWGQGFKDMGPAIDAIELAITDRTLRHPNNPILNWNMANAVATMDPAGNRKLDKDKARFRIDGAVALAMMMGLRSRDRKTKTIDIEALIA